MVSKRFIDSCILGRGRALRVCEEAIDSGEAECLSGQLVVRFVPRNGEAAPAESKVYFF